MVLMVMLMLFVIFFCGNVLNREKPSSLVPHCRGTASFSTQAPPPVPEQNTNLCTISAPISRNVLQSMRYIRSSFEP